jgi:hypothetical protein
MISTNNAKERQKERKVVEVAIKENRTHSQKNKKKIGKEKKDPDLIADIIIHD